MKPGGVSYIVLVLLLTACAFAGLEISKDDTGDKYFHWSSAMHFDATEDVIHAQLPALAKQAHAEMYADIDRLGDKEVPKGGRPTAMAAMAVGQDVYFSSSLKGNQFLLKGKQSDPPPRPIGDLVAPEVAAALVSCQHAYEDPKDHTFSAKCAELMAIQAYIVNNKEAAPLKGRAKVSTYGFIGSKSGVKAPCSTNPKNPKIGERGCQLVLQHLEIEAMGKDGEDPDVTDVIKPTGSRLPNCYWTK